MRAVGPQRALNACCRTPPCCDALTLLRVRLMESLRTKPVRALTALMVGATLALMPTTSARGQATTTVTFNTLTESSPGSGTRYIGNCYAESGFIFTAVGLPCSGAASANAFVAGSANSPLFGGGTTPSLLLNAPDASRIRVTRADGASFNLTGISFAPFDGAATTVVLTGMGLGGTISRTIQLTATQTGFQMFSFADLLGLSSVEIAATNQFGEPLVKFDDFRTVASTVGVIPEPASMVLMATGLLGLGVVVRRRARA